MKVGLIISEKIRKYEEVFRRKLRSGHTLCISTDPSSLRCPVVSGDLSFVAWEACISRSSTISLLHKISDLYTNVPLFLIGDSKMDEAQTLALERLIQYKISDYFNLDSEMDRFIETIRKLPGIDETVRKNIRKIYHTMMGESQNMQDLRLFTARTSKNPQAVLLYGDAGCGKTVVAKTIHTLFYEKRAEKGGDFVSVDLKYIPEDMMECIIFGNYTYDFDGKYTNGSLVHKANKGTFFLKNIDKASLLLQTRLLSLLERMEENREEDVNFKLICSSESSLSNLVSKKKFLANLYYRLNSQEFKIESLGNRQEDIEVLAKHYCELHNCKLHHSSINKLLLHDWKGNVRELFSILNKAIVFARKIGILYPENIRFFD